MATCDANALLQSGNLFQSLGGGLTQTARIAMLKQILIARNPVADTSVEGLLSDARCFTCLSAGELRVLRLQLLCEIMSSLNGGSSTPGSDCVCTSPVITSATLPPASPPYDLSMEWTFEHGSCPVASFEIWKQSNGGGFTLKATQSSVVMTYSEPNIGGTGDTIDYKVRYVNGATVCDFSNTVSLPLFPS